MKPTSDNKIEFTKLIKEVVAQSAIDDTIDTLNDPPGRKPAEDLLAQSKWYKGLDPVDREMVNEILADAVHGAVFEFLCVLDGVRSISGPGEYNELNLSRCGVQLNDESGEYLHDIYNNL